MNTIKNVVVSEDHTLECPNCQGGYLHHKDVAVFNRTEDAEKGTTTVVSPDGAAKQSIHLYGNPSPRRDGLAVNFCCELCDVNLDLLIYQHKGRTTIEWVCQQPVATQSAKQFL